MFYIVRNTFSPNGASSNRALAYYSAMDSLGIDGTIEVLAPDAQCSIIEENYKHLKVVYCWNKLSASNKIFRRLNYYFSVFKFLRSLKKGDKVYVYGSLPCIHSLVVKKGVDTYLEVTEHPSIYPLRTRFFGNTLRKAFDDCKKLKALFVISTELKKCYIQAGVDESKIHIINMIVDTKRFDGIVRNPESRYVCYCGNGNNRKDKVDELISSFSKVSASFPDVNLLIVGPKKQVFKEEKDNIELVRELHLEDRVFFTGVLPADEIPKILVNAEVLVLKRPDTLQNRAGFATKLGEYLASGTLVIATSVGDIPLFLKDGISALLVSPNDSYSFEKKLSWALSHQKESKSIGQNGKEVAGYCFNSLTETKKMIKVIFG